MQKVSQQRTHCHRNGFSLVELLVVITSLVTILTLTGTTFYLLMRCDKSVTQSFVIERTVARLSVQFRNDVHRSSEAVIVNGEGDSLPTLELKSPGELPLRYVATTKGASRLTMENGAITAREDFQLPDCKVRFVAENSPDSKMRTLVIERPGALITRNTQSPLPLRALEIQASLGQLLPKIEIAEATPKEDAALPDVQEKTP